MSSRTTRKSAVNATGDQKKNVSAKDSDIGARTVVANDLWPEHLEDAWFDEYVSSPEFIRWLEAVEWKHQEQMVAVEAKKAVKVEQKS